MKRTFSKQQLNDLAKEHYNLTVKEIKQLAGYDNLNFLMTDIEGHNYVFKIFETTGKNALVEAESRILENIGSIYPGRFQIPVRSIGGELCKTSNVNDNPVLLRMLSWLDGEFLANIEHTSELIRSYGTFMAQMDKALMKLNEPALSARRYAWDLQHFADLKEQSSDIPDPSLRKLAGYYLLQFRENVVPFMSSLRRSIIHNDANDWNVLVRDGNVSGLIDFGDMVEAPLIQETAVALTYVLMDKADPLESAGPYLKAFHEILPLEEKDIDLLYYFIAARLCTSLIHSFARIKEGSADEYALVSQKPAIDLLQRWITISPEKASKVFRQAVGMKIHAKTDYDKELSRRHLHIAKALSVTYQKPVKMVRAAFQYMFDADGNTFLDAYNNIPHVGHQHPRVVEAAQRQMAMLNTNTRYLYDQLADYAERLLAKFPNPLNKVFFVNSGSEASDLAIRIAQTVTGNKQIAVLEHGYHGNTRMGIDISHYKFAGKGEEGAKDFVTVFPIPDTYRGNYRTDDGAAGKAYASDAVQILDQLNKQLAAFIAEPIVGCGGQVPLAKDYLRELYPEIRKRGGLCISDEVQVGFGRLGTHLWGFELHDVVPDIVVLGKPMGNGHPIAAVVTTDEIARAFDNGMEFFSSFGGNPVSCAIGMAVLDVLEEEKLQQNALETGTYFMNELRKLQKEIPQIGDVRGSGLFIGIDLVTDPLTREPNTELAQTLKNKLRENFILVSSDGPADNVIKVKGPVCFGKGDVWKLFESFKINSNSVIM